jgi:hypothetical protein
VIDACDHDPYGAYEPLGVFERDMTDRRSMILSREQREGLTEEQLAENVPKPSEPLPYEEVAKLLVELNQLIKDGYAFRQMQWLLQRTWKKPEEKTE